MFHISLCFIRVYACENQKCVIVSMVRGAPSPDATRSGNAAVHRAPLKFLKNVCVLYKNQVFCWKSRASPNCASAGVELCQAQVEWGLAYPAIAI